MTRFANNEQCNQTPSVVVSGCAGGVGGTLAEYFSARGSRVIGIDRQPAQGLETKLRVERVLQGDLSKQSDVHQVVASIRDLWSHVDILVNAAGTFIADKEIWASFDQWGKMWNDNVTSMVLLSNELYSQLRTSKRGLVVNIASTDGVVASAGQSCEIGVTHDTLYAATKGAVITFTRALAMSWASTGIRVNALCPTIIPSPMTRTLLEVPGKSDQLKSCIPLGSLCAASDVAQAVHAMYGLTMTTGHSLPLDGGYLCQ